MTREEAVKIFNTVLFFGKCDCPKEEIEECFKMAIKALEQESCDDKGEISDGYHTFNQLSNDDAITGIIEYINERGGRNLFKDDSEYDCIIDYIEALPPVQPVGRWIPVSERLPEKGGDYLVTTEWKGSYSGNVYTEANMAVYREKEKEWDCAGVIAWMPSPEPYEPSN